MNQIKKVLSGLDIPLFNPMWSIKLTNTCNLTEESSHLLLAVGSFDTHLKVDVLSIYGSVATTGSSSRSS